MVTVTDFDHRKSEVRTIVSATDATVNIDIDGVPTDVIMTTVTLDSALDNKHFAGDIEISGTWTQHIAVEVGLLTRNIKIQGAEDSDADEYGAHVMMHSPGDDSTIARIEYAEFYRCGQAAHFGRYPIHFHMIGRVT